MDELSHHHASILNGTAGQFACEQHSGERIVAMCLKTACSYPSRLLCVSCLTSAHCEHGLYSMKLTDFNKDRAIHDIAMDWKGDAELPGQILAGVKSFPRNVNTIAIAEELDKLEAAIIEQIRELRKQLLVEIERKQQKGQEEQLTAMDSLSSLLQIKKIQELLTPPQTPNIKGDASKEINGQSGIPQEGSQQQVPSETEANTQDTQESQKEKDCSFQPPMKSGELNTIISKILSESENQYSSIYQQCNDLITYSQCLFSYSVDPAAITEQIPLIKQSISGISSATQKTAYQSYSFQASRAYESLSTVRVLNNSKTILFNNTQSYAVALLNRPISLKDKPITFTFQVEPSLPNKHFCIGLRKESLIHEESYNKPPYKCLHCSNGDGVLADRNSIHQSIQNTFQITFNPAEQHFCIKLMNSKTPVSVKLALPMEEKNSDNRFRLYFWRVANAQPTTLRLLKEERE